MSELGELTDILYQKSIERKVDWKIDDDNRIHTFIGKNVLDVERISSRNIQVTFRNKDGVILVQESFDPLMEESGKKMKGLFEISRRKSLGVDEALIDLKSRLEAL